MDKLAKQYNDRYARMTTVNKQIDRDNLVQ